MRLTEALLRHVLELRYEQLAPAAVAATRVGDEESTEVGWFSPDALPQPLAPTTVTRINDAQAWLASPTRAARFEP